MSNLYVSSLLRPFRAAPCIRSPMPLSMQTQAFSMTTRVLQQARASHFLHRPPRVIAVARPVARGRNGLYFWGAASIAGVGLGLSAASRSTIHCDTDATPLPRRPVEPLPPPPQSAVNLYELSFGTVCGVCAGVFIKKGVKAAAFVLGGVFVLLQYFGSLSLIRVDWSRAATRFENLFYTKKTDTLTGVETKSAPTIGSLFSWIIDFLTADFQQRASFVAGLALGVRVG